MALPKRRLMNVAVLGALVLQGHQPVVEAEHRPDVAVEVEPEAQAEEDVARVLQPRNAGVAEGPEQHGVTGLADDAPILGGKRDPVAQISIGAEVEGHELEWIAAQLGEALQERDPDRDHLLSDAVPLDDRDALGLHGAETLAGGLLRAPSARGNFPRTGPFAPEAQKRS